MTRYHKPIDFCSYNIETVFDEMPHNAESVYHLTVDLLGFRLIPIMNGEEPTGWDRIDELQAQARDFLKAVNDRVLIKQADGTEDKAEFRFVKWERLIRIDIVKEDFIM